MERHPSQKMLEESFSDDDTSKVVKGIVVNITQQKFLLMFPEESRQALLLQKTFQQNHLINAKMLFLLAMNSDLIIMKTDDQDGVLKLSKN